MPASKHIYRCSDTSVIESYGRDLDVSAAQLRGAVARLSKRLRPTAAAGPLTTTEVDVLLAVEKQGPLRLTHLAGFAGLNPTMLSRLVPRLEASGFVRRLIDRGDRRVCLLETTGKGHRLLERIRSERNDALSHLLRDLDAGERDVLAAAVPLLEELAERLLTMEPLLSVGPR